MPNETVVDYTAAAEMYARWFRRDMDYRCREINRKLEEVGGRDHVRVSKGSDKLVTVSVIEEVERRGWVVLATEFSLFIWNRQDLAALTESCLLQMREALQQPRKRRNLRSQHQVTFSLEADGLTKHLIDSWDGPGTAFSNLTGSLRGNCVTVVDYGHELKRAYDRSSDVVSLMTERSRIGLEEALHPGVSTTK